MLTQIRYSLNANELLDIILVSLSILFMENAPKRQGLPWPLLCRSSSRVSISRSYPAHRALFAGSLYLNSCRHSHPCTQLRHRVAGHCRHRLVHRSHLPYVSYTWSSSHSAIWLTRLSVSGSPVRAQSQPSSWISDVRDSVDHAAGHMNSQSSCSIARWIVAPLAAWIQRLV
jgi:hypothetical protein